MGDLAIRVEGLSKLYHIGAAQARYRTLRDTLVDLASTPFRRAAAVLRGASAATATEELWALKDLSFDVKRGEVLGIIGRNGAGKSTLLKILSRITEPTTGRVGVKGRVGSLLEVGTGFHPELTGRENIYLNGAILGMRRAEIDRRFDEIVAFSELERFLDTPVKHYSSGMYTRLAFAVAVHLDPEVLVVDEVLAVGDAEFQKKCFAKMRDVGRRGQTVLFVSHNMAAVRNICSAGLSLDGGRVMQLGCIDDVVDSYLKQTPIPSDLDPALETSLFKVLNVAVLSQDGHPVIRTFDNVRVTVTLEAKKPVVDPGLYLGILSREGVRLAGLDLKDFLSVGPAEAGRCIELGFEIKELPLLPGSYGLEIHAKDMGHHTIDIVPREFPFEVVESPVYGGRHLDAWFGAIGLRAQAFARVR